MNQIAHGFTNTQKRVLIDSFDQQSQKPQTPSSSSSVVSTSSTPIESIDTSLSAEQSDSSIISEYAGIKVGKTYEGFVKLKYNYGIFMTVGELDGLLHKSLIDVPDGVSRKKLYEIGDPIVAKAIEIKELNGRITVVRTQL